MECSLLNAPFEYLDTVSLDAKTIQTTRGGEPATWVPHLWCPLCWSFQQELALKEVKNSARPCWMSGGASVEWKGNRKKET